MDDDGPYGYDHAAWWEGLGKPALKRQWDWRIYGNHPMRRVTWDEAVAFCRWLTRKVGGEVRLPAEEEWEKAARGEGGRAYPWGPEYVSSYANVNELLDDAGPYNMSATAVGIYPDGASPYGTMDMSGNVWEWTSSADSDAPDKRVRRGGSWHDDRWAARNLARIEPQARPFRHRRVSRGAAGPRLICLCLSISGRWVVSWRLGGQWGVAHSPQRPCTVSPGCTAGDFATSPVHPVCHMVERRPSLP